MNAPTAATDGIPLEGRARLPDGQAVGAALLLHPHPAFGGHMDVWLLPTIAQRLADASWATLRINFRGVEGSGGHSSGGLHESRDAAGGVAWLRAHVPEVPIAVVGWSFGAMVGLRLGTTVAAWVGIGTPTRHVDEVPLTGPLVPEVLPPRRTAIVGEHDQFFPPDTLDVLSPHHTVVVASADHFMFDADEVVARHVVAALSGPSSP